MTATPRDPGPAATDPARPEAMAHLFVEVFRRDLQAFYPQCRFDPLPAADAAAGVFDAGRTAGGACRLLDDDGGPDDRLEVFGVRYVISPRDGGRLSAHQRRLVVAMGAVFSLSYHHLAHDPTGRMELYRGGPEDHYVAAFVEPAAYDVAARRPSRVAATLKTLRIAALSTYENRRVSTGALLIGAGGHPPTRATPADALTFNADLTGLKSLYRLCDGTRTVFLVDPEGRLAEVIDINRWPAPDPTPGPEYAPAAVPCARVYEAHARATRSGGHACLVLTPNQEIKLFAAGAQAFAFAHGRWRVLDPAAKYAVWDQAVASPAVARVLFQTALDLAEGRCGGLLVVAREPAEAVGRLLAPHDLLDDRPVDPPAALTPGDPLAKRALYYLARGRNVRSLDPPVLEALAGLDGAIVADRRGALLAFGAILRHDPSLLPGPVSAEGARTTAAHVASHFGPVLKVSEDGVVSCFLQGRRVWDL